MGVKSLWTLLAPVGRPILLETVEGKAMAIDSSIWIYQFQATMRDKEGRALLNAHVLGFLRRISKLLFYGIKPVFVFDGGAPALKRSTLNERKKKKSGASLSHAKIAERLLAAQMRKEALNHAQSKKPSKGKGNERNRPPGDIVLDENTVYLEDIDDSAPKTPAKPKPATPSSTSKKNKYHDHDPYRLPEVDMDEVVAKATRASAPDPRLATEDELRAFIEEMRPEDFDITSPEFRELPTEVQYEIIGDLRLRSRQTSHARLLKMLRMAPTPLDFSKQQIINLKQRNNLTQQLLATTDSIGSAHLTIPVRIASERNRQYVLTKNEGAEGGWVLAIQDKRGAAPENPIMIDVEEVKGKEKADSDDDADMEEVDTTNAADPDLRQYQREMALSAIAGQRSPKKAAPSSAKPISRGKNAKPLFEFDDDDEDAEIIHQAMQRIEDEEDEELALAIQESLDQAKISQLGTPIKKSPFKHTTESSVAGGFSNARRPSTEVDIFTPSGLETALAFAGTGSSRSAVGRRVSGSEDRAKSSFGTPTLLSSPRALPTSAHPVLHVGEHPLSHQPIQPLGDLSSPATPLVPVISGFEALTDSEGDDEMEEVEVPIPVPFAERQTELQAEGRADKLATSATTTQPPSESESEDEDMEEVKVDLPKALPAQELTQLSPTPRQNTLEDSPPTAAAVDSTDALSIFLPPPLDSCNKSPLFTWSRSPSPSRQPEETTGLSESTLISDVALHEPDPTGEQTNAENEQPAEEHWDAANEMDLYAEEGEFARFLSRVKGRELDDVRKEIDDEIKVLNEQRKAAMRDSEDITQQMISQIMTMLRLFGIPYITAPMEAEAQCAELVSLGLVDGVITDDSDVFLFGAQRVYKNMFNQSKTVEVFLLSDLERELGLDRDTLVRLAYLLGSDYTEGLSGAGPVVAMELLKEFPGKDGLHKFADWWRRVQEGKDKESESNTKIRIQFKKKFKDLYIPADWPNPAVRDAYYHPAVDTSEEPFKWGLPDLDALRAFFHQELGWGETKVDELLLPIIRKMNKRHTNASGTASGMQGSLSEWVSTHAGNRTAGNMAPRKKEVYTSHRLQQVVADFRKRRKNGSVGQSRSRSGSGDEDKVSESEAEVARKRQKRAKPGPSRGRGGRGRARGKGRGNGRATSGRKGKAKDDEDYTDEASSDATQDTPDQTQIVEARPRPRPRPVRRRSPTAGTDTLNVMDTVE